MQQLKSDEDIVLKCETVRNLGTSSRILEWTRISFGQDPQNSRNNSKNSQIRGVTGKTPTKPKKDCRVWTQAVEPEKISINYNKNFNNWAPKQMKILQTQIKNLAIIEVKCFSKGCE